MPVNVPQTLTPKFWEQQKGVPDDKKKKLTDALDALAKLHKTVDQDAFEPATKAKDAKEVESRLQQAEAEYKKSVKPAAEKAKSIIQVIESLKKEVKNDALAKAAKEASEYAKSLTDMAEEAKAEFDKLLKDMANAAKKAPAAAQPGKKVVLTPAQRKIKNEAIRCLALVRSKQMKQADQMVAVIGQHEKLVRVTMGLKKANKGFVQNAVPPEVKKKLKWVHAALVYDPDKKVVVFELKSVLKGGLKALKLGLAEQMQIKNVKIGLRKASGEVEMPAAHEEDDLENAQIDQDGSEDTGDHKIDAADFQARLKDLRDTIVAAQSGPKAKEAKALIDKMNAAAKKGDFEEADSVLDEIELLLEEDTPDDAPAASSASSAAAGATASATSAKQIGDALLGLSTAIKGVQQGIEDFRKEMRAAYAGETDQAAALSAAEQRLTKASGECAALEVQRNLAAAMKQPGRDQVASAKQSLDAFMDFVSKHDIIRELDDNELIKMSVVDTLKKRIAAAKSALG